MLHSNLSEPPSSPPVSPRWLVPAAVAACLAYLGAELFLVGGLGFPLDDSWIHLQFARNLAAGWGLSYNPGELVTGSTAPLWTALLALLIPLPGSVLAWTKLLGIAFHAASVSAAWRLARELGLGRGLAGMAAFLMLTTSWLVWSALSGMEIPLFVFLSLWGLLLHIRERRSPEAPPLSIAVLAVASLARPEGLLLLVLALFDRLLVFDREEDELVWRRPSLRPILIGIVFAALALIGPLLAYRWAGGSFLPTTFGAKGAGLRQMLPNLAYVHTVIGVFFRSQPFLALLTGAGIVALISRLGTREDRGLLPALWVVGLPLAYSLLAPGPTKLMGNFGRYYFPLLPVVIVLGMLGLEPAARALKRRPLGALLAGLILATALWGFTQGAMRYARNVANVEDSDVKIARWLAGRVPPQAVLAVNDIGAIKFLLPNPVLDLAAIANPEIRDEVSRIMAETGLPWAEAMAEAIVRRRPDYVVVFPKWLPALDSDPRFQAIHRLEIPDNITMGDNEIVVYRLSYNPAP
jgi:arabinofuranosyltransferase